jgi:hypothetical protein
MPSIDKRPGMEGKSWRALVTYDGRRIHLGNFSTWDEARLSEIKFRISALEDEALDIRKKIAS